MRVLLDENLPRKLALLFPMKFEAVIVAQRGWRGVKNGEPLAMAQREFDVFATTDGGIPHQQNLEGLEIAVVLLRARCNRYEDLAPLMDGIVPIPCNTKLGTVQQVPG